MRLRHVPREVGAACCEADGGRGWKPLAPAAASAPWARRASPEAVVAAARGVARRSKTRGEGKQRSTSQRYTGRSHRRANVSPIRRAHPPPPPPPLLSLVAEATAAAAIAPEEAAALVVAVATSRAAAASPPRGEIERSTAAHRAAPIASAHGALPVLVLHRRRLSGRGKQRLTQRGGHHILGEREGERGGKRRGAAAAASRRRCGMR